MSQAAENLYHNIEELYRPNVSLFLAHIPKELSECSVTSFHLKVRARGKLFLVLFNPEIVNPNDMGVS
jgi:hypothetical protein